MKKRLKKILSLALSAAMIVTSVNVSGWTVVKADPITAPDPVLNIDFSTLAATGSALTSNCAITLKGEAVLVNNPDNPDDETDKVLFTDETGGKNGNYAVTNKCLANCNFDDGVTISANVRGVKDQFGWNYIFAIGQTASVNGATWNNETKEWGGGSYAYCDATAALYARRGDAYIANSPYEDPAGSGNRKDPRDWVAGYDTDYIRFAHANEWHNVTFTYTATSMNAYIDGKKAYAYTYATPANDKLFSKLKDGILVIGAGASENQFENFGGYIDDLKVFQGALTDAEIAVIGDSKLNLNKSEVYLTADDSGYNSADLDVINLPSKEVTWSSSDEAVVTVDDDGKLTAKSAGTATITAAAINAKATCNVTVIDSIKSNITGISAKVDHKTVYVGGNVKSKVSYTATLTDDSKAIYINPKYTSSDEKVATVDENGVITAVASGTALITVSASGVTSDAIDVTVKDNVITGPWYKDNFTPDYELKDKTALKCKMHVMTYGEAIYNSFNAILGLKKNRGDNKLTIRTDDWAMDSLKDSTEFTGTAASEAMLKDVVFDVSISRNGDKLIYHYDAEDAGGNKTTRIATANISPISPSAIYVCFGPDNADISISDVTTYEMGYKEKVVTKKEGDAAFTNDTLDIPEDIDLNDVTFTSSDETVATVGEHTGKVTLAEAASSAAIKATFDGNDKYVPFEASYTVKVMQDPDTKFVDPEDTSNEKTTDSVTYAPNGEYTILATNGAIAASACSITYTSANDDIATVDNTGKVTIKKVGTVSFTAISAQDDEKNIAEGTAVFTLTINKAEAQAAFQQTTGAAIYLDEMNIMDLAEAIIITGDAAEEAVTYGATAPEVEVTTEGMIKVKAVPSSDVTITAYVPATENYNATTAEFTLTIGKKTPDWSLASDIKEKPAYGDVIRLVDDVDGYDGTAAGNEITVACSEDDIVEVAGVSAGCIKIKGITGGAFTVTLSAIETGNCNAPTGEAIAYTFRGVEKKTPVMSFTTGSAVVEYGDAAPGLELNRDGYDADKIKYASSVTGVAIVDENTGAVTIKGIGTTTITAKGTTTTALYNIPEEAVFELEVTAIDPKLTVSPAALTVTYGAIATHAGIQAEVKTTKVKVTSGASVISSPGAITYSVAEGDAVTVNATTGALEIVKAGTATISAMTAANDYYKEGVASYTVTVNPLPVEVSFVSAGPIEVTYGGEDFTNGAKIACAGAVNYKYASAATNVAIVDENTGLVSIKGVGTATISAIIAEGENFTALNTATYIVKVLPKESAMSFGANPDQTKTYGTDKEFTKAVETDFDGTINYGSSDSNVAAVDATGKVTIKKAGAVTITASAVSGSGVNYKNPSPAAVSYKLTINKGTPVISFANAVVTASAVDVTVTNELTKPADYTGTITYASSNTGAAIISGGSIVIVGTGTTDITASGAADANWNAPANATFKLTVVKAAPNMSFASATVEKKIGDAKFTNALTYNGDGAVTYTTSNDKVATVNETTGEVTIVGIGEATITAAAAEGAKYEGKTVSYTVKVAAIEATGVKAPATLTVEAGKIAKIGATVLPDNATDKTLTYTSSNPAVATVAADGTVKGIKAGTAKITIKTANGKTATVDVTVKAAAAKTVPNTELAVKSAKITIEKGKTGQIQITKLTSKTTDKVTYTSKNTKVAVVDANGKITAKKAGSTTIIVKCGSKSVTIAVTVKLSNKKLTVKPKKVNLKLKKKAKVKVTVTKGTTDKITVKLNKKSAKIVKATVKSGKITITAKKKGKATITVKCGKKSAKITVTVK